MLNIQEIKAHLLAPSTVDNYTRLQHLNTDGQPVYACWTCGAIIFDPEKHDRWHVEQVAAQVSR